MDISKKLNSDNIFIFLFLVLFPFGQIIRIGLLQPVDVVAGLGALFAIIGRYKEPAIFKHFKTFIFIAAFSWFFSVFFFRQIEVLYGLLYLIRLLAYFYFFIYVWNFAGQSKSNKNFLIGSLLMVSLVSAAFGWIQYFSFPTIKPFTVWGWDDHLFRLVGTFLDPGFLGIIIVFGLLTAIYLFFEKENKLYLAMALFLLVSLAFTYSRASYLAFFAGLFVAFSYFKKLKFFVSAVAVFMALIFVLPTSGNTILKITREFSVLARIDNYRETAVIFKTSPLFGVGYDNLCLARSKQIGYVNLNSHSCSGSDASLLFILATTGVSGLIVFVRLMLAIFKSAGKTVIISSTLTALLVHSLFTNSFFYPWVLGYLAILFSLNPDLRRE